MSSMKWKEILFDDFCRLNRGFDLPNDNIVNGDVPVVASSSIKAFHNVAKVKGPGVVTGRSGTLGIVQYVEQDYWPLNTSLYVKDFKGNCPKFCYYFLQMLHLENFNSGAGVPTLNQNHLHKLKIKVPATYDEQEKVASVLSNYDSLIDINTQRIKLLEESARELYKEWFVRMRFPGYETTKFVKGIPSEWKVGCLKDVSTLLSKKVKSEDVPIYVTTDNMFKDFQGVDYNELSEKPEGKVCEFEAGDILLSNIRPYFKKVWYANLRGGCSADVLVFRANKVIDQHFLFYTMCTDYFIDYVMAGANGTKMPRGNKAFTMTFSLLIPDKRVMGLFHENVDSIYSIIETLQLQNQNLAATRDRLLPRLLSGELKVKS